jgi:penicillin-binding protein 2
MRNFFFRRRDWKAFEIEPDEIFLDASNLPDFDTGQLEGRLEKPIGRRTMVFLGAVFGLLAIVYGFKLYDLQVNQGEAFALQSENNRLEQKIVFHERGVITDRLGVELVTNRTEEGDDFAHRVYPKQAGFSHLLGYVSYPQKDASGVYFQTEYVGLAGIEKYYGSVLAGVPGLALVETDALGNVQSEGIVRKPVPGGTLKLSVDARVEEKLYTSIRSLAERVGFQGGAGIIMDVNTGELLAITSYPEFDSSILSSGEPKEVIQGYVEDAIGKPFLNRAVGGLYTPGSIVKPYVGIAALTEGVITPNTQIVSTGSISIPNPYTPSQPSVFNDWKAHGAVTLRDALAVSSNVYFYQVGGGFGSQIGLGIARLEEYFRMFGFGAPTGIEFAVEQAGLIPTPEWKERAFPDEPWRIGDTYHTSIGQYGFQVTPLQMVRATAAIANGGRLIVPHVKAEAFGASQEIDIPQEHFEVIREGMRQGVVRGTASGLSLPGVAVASKTGTAELDAGKQYVNSWVTGFFPYDNPRYAFAVVMEQGPRINTIGGVFVMREVLEYMVRETPEYIR